MRSNRIFNGVGDCDPTIVKVDFMELVNTPFFGQGPLQIPNPQTTTTLTLIFDEAEDKPKTFADFLAVLNRYPNLTDLKVTVAHEFVDSAETLVEMYSTLLNALPDCLEKLKLLCIINPAYEHPLTEDQKSTLAEAGQAIAKKFNEKSFRNAKIHIVGFDRYSLLSSSLFALIPSTVSRFDLQSQQPSRNAALDGAINAFRFFLNGGSPSTGFNKDNHQLTKIPTIPQEIQELILSFMWDKDKKFFSSPEKQAKHLLFSQAVSNSMRKMRGLPYTEVVNPNPKPSPKPA